VNRFVVISGCSGGGKSSLLAALAQRGYATVEEPGRRIVRQELDGEGAALPWVDPAAFARRAVALATADLARAARFEGWVFFDRGLIDAVVALQDASEESAVADLTLSDRYHRRVFLTPPWREIYRTDPERRHGFESALAEHQRLITAYPSLGYEVTVLPKVGVSERADLILGALKI